MGNGFCGIISVIKPEGITSFDVVSNLRRIFRIKRIGHCGTLDPFATGVLPVCVGKATAAVNYMQDYDKKYKVKAVFGYTTDTMDKTGEFFRNNTLSQSEIEKLKSEDYAPIRQAIGSLKEIKEQMPPMHSAVKINGKPLYKYARQGIDVDRKPRPVKIHDVKILSISSREGLNALMEISCSKGTYIRSLCEKLGELTGYGAYAHSLERIACGPFELECSIPLEELGEIVEGNKNEDLFGFEGFYKTEYALGHLSRIVLGEDDCTGLTKGRKIEFASMDTNDGPVAVFDQKDVFVGIAKVVSTENKGINILKPERIFADVENYGH